MLIHDIRNHLYNFGKVDNTSHWHDVADWKYYSHFWAGYHLTAMAANYLPRWAGIWDIVKPKKYLVIGILLGTSESYSMYRTRHYPDLIVACDYDYDGYNKDRDNLSYAYKNLTHPSSGNYQNELVLIRTDSKKTQLPPLLGPYDLIFVDGEHGYSAVQKDLVTAKKCLAPGGVIMVHDLELLGEIKTAYDQFLARNPNMEHIEIPADYFQLGLGLIQG